jgi:hypothetical protein
VLLLNDYGMALAWRLYKDGVYPGNHLWGCVELAARGYDVVLPEPPGRSGIRGRVTLDWYPVLAAVRRLGRDDIVFCPHNVLVWTPLARLLRLARCAVVGMLFAREPLPFARGYAALVAHTPVAAAHARARHRGIRCEHLSWGMDLDFFHAQEWEPEWLLSCGKTFRDFAVLADALWDIPVPTRVIHPDPAALPAMPAPVRVESSGTLGEGIYAALSGHYYRYALATLLTIQPDPRNRHSIGLTNVLESMACARPVIATETSAMASEIRLEARGAGRYVAPGDAGSLRAALRRVRDDPEEARAQGLRGRELCEQFFHIDRFADDLHALFDSL